MLVKTVIDSLVMLKNIKVGDASLKLKVPTPTFGVYGKFLCPTREFFVAPFILKFSNQTKLNGNWPQILAIPNYIKFLPQALHVYMYPFSCSIYICKRMHMLY